MMRNSEGNPVCKLKVGEKCFENRKGHFFRKCLWVIRKGKCFSTHSFLIFTSWWNVRQKVAIAIATLCVLCGSVSIHHGLASSVCPLVGIGTPQTPLSPASVPLQFRRLEKSLALFLLCGPPSLRCKCGSQKGGAGIAVECHHSTPILHFFSILVHRILW